MKDHLYCSILFAEDKVARDVASVVLRLVWIVGAYSDITYMIV